MHTFEASQADAAVHALYNAPRLMGAGCQFTVWLAIWRLCLYARVCKTQIRSLGSNQYKPETDRNKRISTSIRTPDVTLSNTAVLLQQEMTFLTACKRTSPCTVMQKGFSGFNWCWLCTFWFPLQVWMNPNLQNKNPLKLMSSVLQRDLLSWYKSQQKLSETTLRFTGKANEFQWT